MSVDTAKLKDEVESSSKWINPLKEEMSKVLVGQDTLVAVSYTHLTLPTNREV